MAHRILFADDDEEDRFLTSEAFAEFGLRDEIYLLESGLKLLGYLDSIINNEQLPAVIVLDLNMPFLNGIETLARLKSNKRFKNIPVIMKQVGQVRVEGVGVKGGGVLFGISIKQIVSRWRA